MNAKTAKLLNRCASARLQQILQDAAKNRTEQYNAEQQEWIGTRVRDEIKTLWYRTPRPKRGRLRRRLQAELASLGR